MSPLLLPILALLLLSHPAQARRLADADAPVPASSGGGGGDRDEDSTDIEEILEKNGQFKTFIRLLDDTDAGDQIDNQLKNKDAEGLTVFTPNDNAFNGLKSGALNDLTPQQKTQLVQSHIVPKYYNLTTLQEATNPLHTQSPWGLNVTSRNNQVNVSTGTAVSPVNNALTKGPPLMVFEVTQVLMPKELTAPNNATAAADSSPPPGTQDSDTAAKTPAGAPEASGASRNRLGLGLLAWLAFAVAL